MIHTSRDTKRKSVAGKVLIKLADNFGRDLCEYYIAPEIRAMTDDLNPDVRKVAIQSFASVCEKVTSTLYINKLLPIYKMY